MSNIGQPDLDFGTNVFLNELLRAYGRTEIRPAISGDIESLASEDCRSFFVVALLSHQPGLGGISKVTKTETISC